MPDDLEKGLDRAFGKVPAVTTEKKKYPEWSCETCFANSSRNGSPSMFVEFKFDGFEPETACGICGEVKPVEDTSNLGYPFFEGFDDQYPREAWQESCIDSDPVGLD